MLKETINSYEELLEMLDSLFREPTEFWDEFYNDREKGIPFFINAPDENLVQYFAESKLKQGKVLELGCGPGRNAIYFAEKGCSVDAVDLSRTSIEWATERARERNVEINFIQKNIFDLSLEDEVYDIIYDSGCFHHIAPHRRLTYLEMIKRALKPKGRFGITTFVQGGPLGGADLTDWEVYELRSLKGGLGFTEEKLRIIFKDFKEIELRRMIEMNQSSSVFGVNGLWTALFEKTY